MTSLLGHSNSVLWRAELADTCESSVMAKRRLTSTTCTRASSSGAVKSPKRWIPFLSPRAFESAVPSASAACITFQVKYSACLRCTATDAACNSNLENKKAQPGMKCKDTNIYMAPAHFSKGVAGNDQACIPMSSLVWWSSIQVSPSASTITLNSP